MPITIVGPKSVTLPSSLGGDDTVYSLVVVTATRGLYVQTVDQATVKLTGITDTSLVTIDIVSLLISKGCEVHGYDAFFELTEEQLDQEVPESFPNRLRVISIPETMGEEPVTEVHTWRTWGIHGDSHAPFLLNGKWYKGSADAANLGQPLPMSLVVQEIANGFVVKSPAEIAALRPAPNL